MPSLARDITKNRCSFIGNIDPSGVLALGDQQTVAMKTKELLALFGATPGFILNAGCAIPAETPPENIHTMIRTAREFYKNNHANSKNDDRIYRLGVMGKPMSLNLIKAGYSLMVSDINPDPEKELIAAGALKGNSPRHIGESCESDFYHASQFP